MWSFFKCVEHLSLLSGTNTLFSCVSDDELRMLVFDWSTYPSSTNPEIDVISLCSMKGDSDILDELLFLTAST